MFYLLEFLNIWKKLIKVCNLSKILNTNLRNNWILKELELRFFLEIIEILKMEKKIFLGGIFLIEWN